MGPKDVMYWAVAVLAIDAHSSDYLSPSALLIQGLYHIYTILKGTQHRAGVSQLEQSTSFILALRGLLWTARDGCSCPHTFLPGGSCFSHMWPLPSQTPAACQPSTQTHMYAHLQQTNSEHRLPPSCCVPWVFPENLDTTMKLLTINIKEGFTQTVQLWDISLILFCKQEMIVRLI